MDGLGNLDARFADLNTRIDGLDASARLDALGARMDGLGNLDARFADVNTRIDGLDASARLDALGARMDGLGNLDARFSDLNARIDGLGDVNARFGDVDGRLVAVNSRVDGLGHVQGRLDGHDKALGDFDARINAVNKRVDDLGDPNARLNNLDQRLGDLDSKVGSLPDRMGQAEGGLQDLDARVRAINYDAPIQAVEDSAQQAHARLDALGNLPERLSIHDGFFTDHDARLKALQAEIGVTDAEVQGVSARLNVTTGETQRAHQRIDALDYGARLAELDGRLSNLAESVQRPAVAAAPAAPTAPAAPVRARRAGSGDRDDLKLVEGIGPKIEKTLHKAGLLRFEDVAEASVETLRAAIEAGGIRFAPSIISWSKQARYLADGDEAALKAYQDQLIAGREA
jgi:predicted flap endonuclease-1-like 5' DNA nuclease